MCCSYRFANALCIGNTFWFKSDKFIKSLACWVVNLIFIGIKVILVMLSHLILHMIVEIVVITFSVNAILTLNS